MVSLLEGTWDYFGENWFSGQVSEMSVRTLMEQGKQPGISSVLLYINLTWVKFNTSCTGRVREAIVEHVCKPAHTQAHTFPQCSAFFIMVSGQHGQVLCAEVSLSLARLLEQLCNRIWHLAMIAAGCFILSAFWYSRSHCPQKNLLTCIPLSEHSTWMKGTLWCLYICELLLKVSLIKGKIHKGDEITWRKETNVIIVFLPAVHPTIETCFTFSVSLIWKGSLVDHFTWLPNQLG